MVLTALVRKELGGPRAWYVIAGAPSLRISISARNRMRLAWLGTKTRRTHPAGGAAAISASKLGVNQIAQQTCSGAKARLACAILIASPAG
jgi:hypothetical protein